jgi:hypothetical protein
VLINSAPPAATRARDFVLDSVARVLEQSPMLALFAVIGLGYALGQISIRGFSLGVGAVLFAGLAVGAIAPKAVPPALVSSIGLVMFPGDRQSVRPPVLRRAAGPGLRWNVVAAIGARRAGGAGARIRAAMSPAYDRTVRSLTST